ncbi:hypothetical protein BE20_24795 [Sorangium cellulosum]|uniref:Copper type II ascorbate-dependent monooxygenase C-terminal domain-containing protein n=1 Tax=Sorangium cellulosum TaxID=56 RepID=A0A150S602_SORCE|nr:hypothetical protein BE18_51695 [Sorangium cellulosum]KYF87827.1 hypothetical protein BE20_24795 [Sorangium cellulosum]
MRTSKLRSVPRDRTRTSRLLWIPLLWTPLLPACAGLEPSPPAACAPGEELFRGRCVHPAARYEPEERIDRDNVVAFGAPLTRLRLPEPPRSGFRIIAPPRTLAPGEEALFCRSWPFPALVNETVHAARLYTTAGLHHSNVIAKPVNPSYGPNPYPDCHPGADDAFGALPAVIPDVLFASSTQVVGDETLVFPEGMGFTLDTTREIATSVHLLNTSAEPEVVELAYDFFTMPMSERTEELVPFVMNVNDFRVPPRATRTVGATCSTFGGNIVSLMPHTHRYAEAFDVDVVREDGGEARVYEGGAFDLEGDIEVYRPAIALEEGDSLRYACRFRNTSDHDLTFGFGDNEMCTLFGYMYPPEKQLAAVSLRDGEPCLSFGIGALR